MGENSTLEVLDEVDGSTSTSPEPRTESEEKLLVLTTEKRNEKKGHGNHPRVMLKISAKALDMILYSIRRKAYKT